MELIPPKELTIGEILSLSWKIFTENFQQILLIVFIIYIPLNIILSFFIAGLSPSGGETLASEQFSNIQVAFRVSQILESLIGIIATMAIAYLVKSTTEGRTIDFKTALRVAASKWPTAIGTNILTAIFLIGLFILFIVPGIIYSVYWMFVPYAVILSGKAGKAAMDYSKEIVQGRWWRVFGYSFFFGILATITGFLAAFPGMTANNIITNIASDTLIDVATSFFIVVFTIFFLSFEKTKQEAVVIQK